MLITLLLAIFFSVCGSLVGPEIKSCDESLVPLPSFDK